MERYCVLSSRYHKSTDWPSFVGYYFNAHLLSTNTAAQQCAECKVLFSTFVIIQKAGRTLALSLQPAMWTSFDLLATVIDIATSLFSSTATDSCNDAQVKIMKEWDPSGKQGPKMPLPDIVKIHEPKENEEYGFDDDKEAKFNKVKESGGAYGDAPKENEGGYTEQQGDAYHQQQANLAA